MPNQTGNKSDFFYNLLEVLLRKIGVDEESEEFRQLVTEEDILWANASDDEIEEFLKRSLKMVKGNEGLRRLNARKRRSMAKKSRG